MVWKRRRQRRTLSAYLDRRLRRAGNTGKLQLHRGQVLASGNLGRRLRRRRSNHGRCRVSTDMSTMWQAIGDLPHTLEYVQVGKWNTRVLTVGAGEETIILLAGTS